MAPDNKLGLHLTFDLKDCKNPKLLTDTSFIYDVLMTIPKEIGMMNITLPYVVKWLDKGTSVEGVTGFVIIAESHISIHTYPEKKGVYMDIFSCKPFHINKATNLVSTLFQTSNYDREVIKRGFI